MPVIAFRTSTIIKEIIRSADQEGKITLGEFMALLGDRAFCLAILVFSLPNSLPVPGIPGFSTITGLPITFIALQMVMGKTTIWLPRRLANKAFSRQGVANMLAKALPSLTWIEKCLRPRWLPVTSPWGEKVLGLLMIALSLIIALPIPGGNFLPGFSMSLLALGMLEKDGLFVVASGSFAVSSILFMFKIITLFFAAAVHAILPT